VSWPVIRASTWGRTSVMRFAWWKDTFERGTRPDDYAKPGGFFFLATSNVSCFPLD